MFFLKGIQREEEKTKRMLKDSAKKGEKESCRILAREIVNAEKQIKRMYASKAHLSSVQMSMKQQLGDYFFILNVNIDKYICKRIHTCI